MHPTSDTDEQRTDAYREAVLRHLAEQTKTLETIKTIAVLFTVLFFLGVLAWAIIFIRSGA